MLVIQTAKAQAEALARAEHLLREANPAAALQLLDSYQPTSHDATQRLLWARSVAHMRQREPAAALPHLERLVAMAPRQPNYRLELAAALGQLGQTERALYHIEIARSAGLPQQVDARAAAYAQRLENPKVISGQFSFAIVPESNAGKRTSATEVVLFGLPFQINPDSRATPATGLELSAGVAASPQFAPGWRAQIGFSGRVRLYDGKAPNDYHARLYAGLIHGFLETGQTRAQIFATQRWLDQRDYSRSQGLSLSYARRLNPSTRWNANFTHERLAYRRGEQVHRNSAVLGLTHLVNPQLEVSFGTRIELRGATTPALAGQLIGFNIGGQYRFEGGLQIAMNVDYARDRYNGRHSLFLIQRKDKTTTARLEISNSQWNWQGFAPVLRVSTERQKSTIVINDFRNIGASIGVTRRF